MNKEEPTCIVDIDSVLDEDSTQTNHEFACGHSCTVTVYSDEKEDPFLYCPYCGKKLEETR